MTNLNQLIALQSNLDPRFAAAFTDNATAPRLLPDGFLDIEHAEGKCGGSSVCQYCEAQEEANATLDPSELCEACGKNEKAMGERACRPCLDRENAEIEYEYDVRNMSKDGLRAKYQEGM